MLELKYAISEIKNSLNGFNIRLDSTEEKSQRIRRQSKEITQTKTKKEHRMNKPETSKII